MLLSWALRENLTSNATRERNASLKIAPKKKPTASQNKCVSVIIVPRAPFEGSAMKHSAGIL